NIEPLIDGLWKTIWITFVSYFIALVFGVIIGLMRTSEVGILKVLAQIYIDIMRGSPLIVLAFFIYFGIPQMSGLKFNASIAGILTLSLDRKSTRLNSSHVSISYAVFCLKKKRNYIRVAYD